MTTDTTPPELEPTNFTTPERDTSDARFPFTLNDDPTILWAVRPKTAILLRLGQTASAAEDSGDKRVLISLYDQFMDTVLDPSSATYLREQFEDPESELDVDALDPVLTACLGKWYGGPTRRKPASDRLPRTTGKRSTGRVRSKGSTR